MSINLPCNKNSGCRIKKTTPHCRQQISRTGTTGSQRDAWYARYARVPFCCKPSRLLMMATDNFYLVRVADRIEQMGNHAAHKFKDMSHTPCFEIKSDEI